MNRSGVTCKYFFLHRNNDPDVGAFVSQSCPISILHQRHVREKIMTHIIEQDFRSARGAARSIIGRVLGAACFLATIAISITGAVTHGAFADLITLGLCAAYQ